MPNGMRPSPEEQLVEHLDETYGLRRLKREWASRQTVSSHASLKRAICSVDIWEISHGSLPWNPQDAHAVHLGVKALVQIDDVINVGSPDPKGSTPRLLQFLLSDGAVRFIAIEPLSAQSSFSVNTLPGTKVILLPTTLVRRGRVILSSEDYKFLGSPPRSLRRANRGDGTIAEGLARLGQSAASNANTLSRAQNLNSPSTHITSVGGIAAITEPSDEDADDNELWSEYAAVRGRRPPPVRDFIRNPSSARINEELTGSSIQRYPLGRHEANRTHRSFQPNKRIISDATNEQEPRVPARSPFNEVEQPDPSFRKYDELNHNENNAGQAPNLHVSEDMQVDTFRSPRGAYEDRDVFETSERNEAPESTFLPFTRLSHLVDGADPFATKGGLCRLYALKTRKRTGFHLTRDVVATIADDGSLVKVITLQKDLASTLTKSTPTRNVTNQQDVDESLRRSLRGICGFVQIECRNNKPLVTSFVSGPHASLSMLSKYLSEVEARFAIYSTR